MSSYLSTAKQVATKAVTKADKLLKNTTGTLRNKADTSPREYQTLITAHRATLVEVINKITHLHQELKNRIDNGLVAIDKPLADSWLAKYRDHLRQLNVTNWVAMLRSTLQEVEDEIASAEEAEQSERNRTKRSEELMLTAIELSTRSFRGAAPAHGQRTSTSIASEDDEAKLSLTRSQVGGDQSFQESDQSFEMPNELDRFYELDLSSEDEVLSMEMSFLASNGRGRPSSSHQSRHVERYRSSGPPPSSSKTKPVKIAFQPSRIKHGSVPAWNELDSDSDHHVRSDESQNHSPSPNYSFSSDSDASEPSANQKLKQSEIREKKLRRELKAEKEKRLQLEKRTRFSKSLDSEKHSSSSKFPSIQIQRPSVKLPTFSGNQSEFSQFSKTFRVMVGETHEISNVEKLIYLRQALSGAAFKTIQRIEISDGGYQIAWSKLDRRYGDAGQVKDALMQRLVNATVTKTDYRKMLNDLDDLTEIAQELENQGENINSQLIFFPILTKFPADIQAEVTPKLHSKKFDGTFERFQIEIEKAIRAQLIRTGGFSESSRLHQHRTTDMVIAQINAQAESPSSYKWQPSRRESRNPKLCPFGDGEHKPIECSVKLENKLKTIELEKRCLNCLKPNHSVDECYIKFTCKNCEEKHHTAICEAFEYAPLISNSTPSPATGSKKLTPKDEQITEMFTTVLHAKTNNKRFVFLPLSTTKNDIIIALIDSGAECSLISEKAAARLKLKAESHSKMTIEGINSSYSYDSKKFEIHLKSELPTPTWQVHSYPNFDIVIDIPEMSKEDEKAINNSFLINTLKNIRQSRNGTSIDAIIGADKVWNWVNKVTTTELPSKLTLLGTPMGECLIPVQP